MSSSYSQQPTSSTYARPRQPADSPAAALPSETLSQILELSLHDLSPAARQTTRFAFSKVCRHWYDLATATATNEIFVSNSSKAERLTTSLLASSTERREMVRGLVIEVEEKEKTGSRGTRLAQLLLSCPKLERLHLTLVDSLGGNMRNARSGTLGSALHIALSKSTSIQDLELHGIIRLPADALAWTLPLLVNLRRLVAPTLSIESGGSRFGNFMPPGLERLEMRHCDRYGLVEALVKAASTSITQLRLGEAGFPPTDLINALIPGAPRLVEVELISESTHSSDYMRPFLQKLARVRILQISVYGYDPSKLFAMLEQLPTLESFTLKLSPFFLDRSVSRLPVIKAANAISFIRQARLLKSLTLPVELRKIWSLNAELAGVEQAAFFGNVKLSFKRGEGTSCE